MHNNDPVPSVFDLGDQADGGDAGALAGAQLVRFARDPESDMSFVVDPGSEALDLLPKDVGEHSVASDYLKMEK